MVIRNESSECAIGVRSQPIYGKPFRVPVHRSGRHLCIVNLVPPEGFAAEGGNVPLYSPLHE